MAREALPDMPGDTPREHALAVDARIHYAAGISAERARVVAWLREHAVHSHLATILADDLEGSPAARPR